MSTKKLQIVTPIVTSINGETGDVTLNSVQYTAQTLTDEQKAQARENIGAIGEKDVVQSDWAQNDETAPDYVKNRPGGYEITVQSQEITWDGNLNGKTTVVDDNVQYVLVSDAIFTAEQLIGGSVSIVQEGNVQSSTISSDIVTQVKDGVLSAAEYLLVISVAGVTLSNMTFPSTGTYFAYAQEGAVYVSGLTSSMPATTTIIKKIPAKYLDAPTSEQIQAAQTAAEEAKAAAESKLLLEMQLNDENQQYYIKNFDFDQFKLAAKTGSPKIMFCYPGMTTTIVPCVITNQSTSGTTYTMTCGEFCYQISSNGKIQQVSDLANQAYVDDAVANAGMSHPLILEENTDYGDTLPTSAQAGQLFFQQAGTSLFDLVYPVGAVYISMNNTDPGTLFGGTWTKVEGKFLLGTSTTYPAGSEGGEETHTLTVAEMPNHNHNFAITGGSNTASKSGILEWQSNVKYQNWGTEYRGGGEAHNNMPPYLAVNMWYRTA